MKRLARLNNLFCLAALFLSLTDCVYFQQRLTSPDLQTSNMLYVPLTCKPHQDVFPSVSGHRRCYAYLNIQSEVPVKKLHHLKQYLNHKLSEKRLNLTNSARQANLFINIHIVFSGKVSKKNWVTLSKSHYGHDLNHYRQQLLKQNHHKTPKTNLNAMVIDVKVMTKKEHHLGYKHHQWASYQMRVFLSRDDVNGLDIERYDLWYEPAVKSILSGLIYK
jgi:hypothetical protein